MAFQVFQRLKRMKWLKNRSSLKLIFLGFLFVQGKLFSYQVPKNEPFGRNKTLVQEEKVVPRLDIRGGNWNSETNGRRQLGLNRKYQKLQTQKTELENKFGACSKKMDKYKARELDLRKQKNKLLKEQTTFLTDYVEFLKENPPQVKRLKNLKTRQKQATRIMKQYNVLWNKEKGLRTLKIELNKRFFSLFEEEQELTLRQDKLQEDIPQLSVNIPEIIQLGSTGGRNSETNGRRQQWSSRKSKKLKTQEKNFVKKIDTWNQKIEELKNWKTKLQKLGTKLREDEMTLDKEWKKFLKEKATKYQRLKKQTALEKQRDKEWEILGKEVKSLRAQESKLKKIYPHLIQENRELNFTRNLQLWNS